MKKSLILILIFVVVAIAFFILNYKEYEINQIDLNNFNLEYENFNKEKLNGLDITTVMNLATSNNEKYGIEALTLHDGIYVKESDAKRMNELGISTEEMFKEFLINYKK